MKSKWKLSLLCMLVVFSVSLVASSTAVAAEEMPTFISLKEPIKEELPGVGTINKFLFEIKGLNFGIGCKGVDNEVDIGADMHSKLKIEFTECFVYNLLLELRPECKVKEPIDIKLRDQLVYKNHKKGEEILDVFYPNEEPKESKFHAGVMTAVHVEGGTCEIKGVYEIKGSAIAIPSPNTPGNEAKKIKLSFNDESAPTGKYENEETKTEEEAGVMVLNGKAVYLKGEVEQELKNKDEYGAK